MPLSLQELEERLSAVEGTLACLEADLKDLREALGAEDVTPLDVAKGNVTLAYSVILLTHSRF